MRSLQGAAATELAVASSVLAGIHAAPSCAQNSPGLTFRQRKLHRFLAVPITLSAKRLGAAAGARSSGINNYHPGIIRVESKLGGLWGGREGFRDWWSTGLGSRFVGHSNAEKGQCGSLVDAVKNSAVCSQCRTRLSGGSFAWLSSSTSTYGGGGGRGTGGRGAGGGGGGGGDGFEARASGKGGAAVGGEQSDELPVGSSGEDVIILDVGGMSCGGCSASVKRILESQPQVSLANVNLATETAFVQLSFDGQAQTDRATLKHEIGELLAKHLTSCGFKSTVREFALNPIQLALNI